MSSMLNGGVTAPGGRRLWFRKMAGAVLTAALVVAACGVSAQTQITLKNSFIEKYKHRVTIDATFTIDAALRQPHKAKSDGDLHIAGRAPEIGLATVAEIMNAASEPEAVDQVHRLEGTSTSIQMTGAWRIWSEHGGQAEHVQGAPLSPFTDSNPDHIFEIHPVTRLGTQSLLNDLHTIEGYDPKAAADAFSFYERVRCRLLIRDENTTTIDTEMAGFNYVEFQLQLLTDEQFPVQDGTMAFASVLDTDGEMIIRKRRMVFVKGSAPEQKLKTMHKGDVMHVLGIPRISLALVSWRLKNARQKPEVLTWNLPYEMIIVGLYDDAGTP